jgi:hypothetical protein
MQSKMSEPTSPVLRVSSGLLTVVSIMVALSSLWVALTPVGDQTELEGRTWDQFAQQDPEVASLYSMDVGILGMLGAGLGLIAAAISVIPYRRGERWAWYALWLLPATVGGVTARMLADQYSTGYYYAGVTAAAVVALLLPIRDFLRPRE